MKNQSLTPRILPDATTLGPGGRKRPCGRDAWTMPAVMPVAKLTLVTLTLVFAMSQHAFPNRSREVAAREAVNRSLSLLQSSSSTFMQNSGCVSCHGQLLGLLTFELARRNGFRTDDRAKLEATQGIVKRWSGVRERLMEGSEFAATIDASYALAALGATGYHADMMTDSLVYHLAGRQAADGHWRSTSYRPPMEYSEFTATALCVRALQLYAPRARISESNARIKRARAWLLAARPATNEERVFRLMGLHWAGATPSELRRAARDLLAEQRSDGGWSQLATLDPDGYATGQALVALNESNSVSVSSLVYRRGVLFLQRTQLADGSWEVQSRSDPVLPPVDSGFPHGKNQFISAAGTNWATMAVILKHSPRGSRVF